MTSPRLFTFAILPVFGLPSIWERRSKTKAARPAQAGTDFSNVYAGCAGVPPVPPLFDIWVKVREERWESDAESSNLSVTA